MKFEGLHRRFSYTALFLAPTSLTPKTLIEVKSYIVVFNILKAPRFDLSGLKDLNRLMKF